MIGFALFLAVAALVLFMAYQVIRLVVFIGVVLFAGVGLLLMGALGAVDRPVNKSVCFDKVSSIEREEKQ